MTITVGDVLGTSHLGLSLVAGANGLDRQVTWTHVSELDDPARWLEGGELLMTTGIGVPPEPRRQCEYIRRLHQAGVAAIAISAHLHAPPLSDAMRREADRLRFPVLQVSIEVPFTAIARMVAASTQEEAQARLLTHLRIFDLLRSTTGEFRPKDLFGRLGELSGFDLFLVSTNGRQLFEDIPAPPPEFLSSHLPHAPGEPPWIPGGYVISLPLAGRTAGYLFALERDGASRAGLAAVQHVATIAALVVANRAREREVVRREGAETLAELLSGVLDVGSAARRLSLAGFDPERELVLVAIHAPEGFDTTGLHHAWSDLGFPDLLLQQRELYALFPADAEALSVVQQEQVLRGGCSSPFRIESGLAKARREAQWALQRAIEGDIVLARFPVNEEAAEWLPADAASLNAIVDRVLGPVLGYDAARRTDLVRSLRVWLQHERRMDSAAAVLCIHKHTLSYRLKRIEQLTGRDLSRMQDLVELWLALHAYDVVSEESEKRLRPLPLSVPGLFPGAASADVS